MASERFIQLSIPCKECLVSPICKDKIKIDDQIKKHNLYYFMLGLGKWDQSEKSYKKGLIEAWANMGWSIFATFRSSDYGKKTCFEFIHILIELSSIAQWIIHSTSWRDGKQHDFDKIEIENKIKDLLNNL